MTATAYLAELEAINANAPSVIDGMIAELKRLKKAFAENQKLVQVLREVTRPGTDERTESK